MVSNDDRWVRIFDIPETNKHKKGFTIYKTVSMLYPKSCPDAVTKITVWKRFNDFKKLHRQLKSKNQHSGGKFPSLSKSLFFKRFDEEIIQERRQSILNFLEFVASHSQLFTCNEFVKFFESSYTPSELLNGNINSIKAELNLPVESEYYAFHSPISDDEHTLSDTDSLCTISSLNLSIQNAEQLPDPINKNSISHTQLNRKLPLDPALTSSQTSKNSDSHDSLSLSMTNVSLDSIALLENQMFPTPPHTPSSSNIESPSNYILDAAQHITLATEYEIERKYEEAFAEYKAGIDILLRNVKEDKDYDRKEIVRRKTEKYLLRAEKIYNLYISPEIKDVQQYVQTKGKEKEVTFQKPSSDLHKYKVVKVICSGMLVLHSELQQLYYVKVIHKSSLFSIDNLILPENVPYMVKLHNYYSYENALFLVVDYCSGTKLWDYIKQCENVFEVHNKSNYYDNSSDCESDHSYSDLISDYTSRKCNEKEQALSKDLTSSLCDIHSEFTSSIDSFVKINFEENPAVTENDSVDDSNVIKPKEKSTDVNDLLTKSHELLSSVEVMLQTKEDLEGPVSHKDAKIEQIDVIKSSPAKPSDRSQLDDLEFTRNTMVPLEDATKWSAQLVLALEKLHQYGVICCDLQLKNLLVDESGDLRVTYMCTAVDKCDVAFINRQTSLAPELYTFQPVTTAVDWWSFGSILYQLLVGVPLNVIHPEGLTSYTTLKIPKYVPMEGKSLLKQLLVHEPHERLGCGVNGTEELKSHPFFNSVSWNNLIAKYKN